MLFGTGHNTVDLFRLASSACFSKSRRRTIELLFHQLKILNHCTFPVKHRPAQLRRLLAVVLTILCLLLVNCKMPENSSHNSSSGRGSAADNSTPRAVDAETVHQHAIVIDLHADTTQRMLDEGVDLSQRLADGHVDSVRARTGGLDAQFFSIWVEPELYGAGGPRAIKRADDQIAAVRSLAAKHPEMWEVATSASDVRRIAASGKLAALFGLEGGYAIDDRIENVERYYNLGVRYMSPAWTVSTSWAGSSGDERGKTLGLTDFGKQVIREMNRLGMMVDVSHLSDKAFWDIVATSTKPVIATHSACRAIANVPRNLDDEMIKALAKTGGVVCVIFYPAFLEPGWSAKKDQVDKEIAGLVKKASDAEPGDTAHKKLARDRVRREEFARRLPPVTVARVVDHIDHIVQLVGIDHVGIGSDFDGIQATLSDLASVADLPNLTKELLKRGYSEGDIDKILGGNVLRVMDEVQKK
jgi:membrane dipeptidase